MVPTTIVNGVYKPSYHWGAPHCSNNDQQLRGFNDQLPELRRQRWLFRAMPTSGCHIDVYHQIDAW